MSPKISLKMNNFKPTRKDLLVLDLSTGISDRLDGCQIAFFKKLKEESLKELFGIRKNDLEAALKTEIRRFLKVKDIISNENIVFGFGSYSILERLAWKFLEKGLMVGEFPQFRFFPLEYLLAGGSYKGFWRKDFSFPKEEILRTIDKSKNLKAVYINNPNNPTGQVFEKKEVLEVIKKAERKNIPVIIDEVYGDLLPAENSFAGLVNRFSNLLVLRSFSKIFGLQNLRLGYLVAGRKIITRYQDICNWNEINNFGAISGLMLLRDKNYLKGLRRECLELKKRTMRILYEQGFEITPTNLFVPIIFVRKENLKIERYFSERNIKVDYSGKNFRALEKTFSEDWVRIRIPATKNDLEILKQRLCLSSIKVS